MENNNQLLEEIHESIVKVLDCELLPTSGEQFVLHPTYKVVLYSPKLEPSETKEDDAQSVVQAVARGSWIGSYLETMNRMNSLFPTVIPTKITVVRTKTNKSLAEFSFKLYNTGKSPLERTHIFLESDNPDVLFYDTNVEASAMYTNLFDLKTRLDNRRISNDNKRVHYEIADLNSGLCSTMRSVFVRVPYECTDFKLQWAVNAIDFQKTGVLDVKVIAETEYDTAYSSDGTRYQKFEDYIVINDGEEE